MSEQKAPAPAPTQAALEMAHCAHLDTAHAKVSGNCLGLARPCPVCVIYALAIDAAVEAERAACEALIEAAIARGIVHQKKARLQASGNPGARERLYTWSLRLESLRDVSIAIAARRGK